jgi:hypothetical protein
MTAIEHRELKGITVKNLVVTLMSTASIVASVMTTYFGLKNDIADIKAEQTTETRINNVRLKILEDQIAVLQKQLSVIKLWENYKSPTINSRQDITNAALLSVNQKNK